MESSIQIFGKEIPLYGLFFYIGIACASVVAALICKRKKIDRYDLLCAGVYTMIGALIGAKLLFILVSIDDIIKYNIPFEYVLKGGFVFYGGLLGGILGLFIYSKQFKESFVQLAELFATVLPLGHAFGRVGCFFAGCCYGIPYDGPFSHTYHNVIGQTPTGVPLLPVQLIEAACLLVIFVVMMIRYFKTKEKYGTAPVTYLMIYSVLRFILEFFRGDEERGKFLGLATSQWVSIGLLTVAIVVLVLRYQKKKQMPAMEPTAEEPPTSNNV